MRIRLTTLVLFAAALACASTAAAAAPIAHPTGATTVVLRVTSDGGFVAPGTILGAVPAFSLYGDGTVIVPGAVPQIFPGPAISPLQRTQLSEQRVQALLRRAKAAGLLARGRIDYGDMGTIGVADAPTTTLRLRAAGRSLVRQAYALGITAGSDRMPPAQAEARRALARFIRDLPRGLKGARSIPRALAVYVSPYGGQAKPGENTIAWPLASDLATAGKPPSSGSAYRCLTVAGAQARSLLAVLKRANEQTRWRARGSGTPGFGLIVRPLLPDERDCSSLSR
jgi:hypothetical protein